MKKSFIAVSAGVGMMVVAGATPAFSMTASPTPIVQKTKAGVVDVGYRDRYSRRRPYYQGYSYGYRPYYRPYGYYRPYAYYPYYYRRPGVSFGFWF